MILAATTKDYRLHDNWCKARTRNGLEIRIKLYKQLKAVTQPGSQDL